jgi:hypothetical protein
MKNETGSKLYCVITAIIAIVYAVAMTAIYIAGL